MGLGLGSRVRVSANLVDEVERLARALAEQQGAEVVPRAVELDVGLLDGAWLGLGLGLWLGLGPGLGLGLGLGPGLGLG